MNVKTLLIAAAFLAPAALAHADGGDAKAGAEVFKKCMACHVADQPTNKVGPSLQGVVGRPVASFAGYAYSAAMKAHADGGKVWDEAALTEYLKAPQAVVKGTKMAFPGLKDDKDIANLIAYLKDPAAAK